MRSVAHAHGGDVDASPRNDGGLTVRVRLPAAPEKPKPNSAGLK
jgi:signal transduction histidine kinase